MRLSKLVLKLLTFLRLSDKVCGERGQEKIEVRESTLNINDLVYGTDIQRNGLTH